MPSEAYKAATAKIAELKKQMQETVKAEFEKEAVQLVKDMGIESFSWTQYTPYFNDGDACVFSVNSDYPSINGFDEDGYNEETDEELETLPARPDWSLRQTDPAEYERQYALFDAPYRQVREFLSGYTEEDMHFMFGDHAIVRVTKDGIESDFYDHD